MSGDFVYADIIILALIAGFVLLRLRSILGEKSGLMEPGEGLAKPVDKSVDNTNESNVIDLPLEESDETLQACITQKKLLPAVKKLREADPSFHISQFLDGAKSAFEMVLEAYRQSDKKTLKFLLSDDLYKEFAESLKEEEESSQHTETTLVSIESAKISHATVKDKKLCVTVTFVTEQITVEKDNSGKVIKGDPSAIERVKDIWIFERPAKASDPNWTITDTQG